MVLILRSNHVLRLGTFISAVHVLVTPYLHAIQMCVKEMLLW
jgi:hypothetical protein